MALQAPRLPDPPAEYDPQYFAQLNQILTFFLLQLTELHALQGASLNLDLRTLPTDADLANLRSGDVYMDTGGSGPGPGSGVTLKIKT